MSMIEFAPGAAVSASAILVLEESREGTRIITAAGEFMSNLPYKTLRDLVNRQANRSERALDQLARFQMFPVP